MKSNMESFSLGEIQNIFGDGELPLVVYVRAGVPNSLNLGLGLVQIRMYWKLVVELECSLRCSPRQDVPSSR